MSDAAIIYLPTPARNHVALGTATVPITKPEVAKLATAEYRTLRQIIHNTDLGPLDRFKLSVTAYHLWDSKGY